LEQIQFLLGHVSVETTERYLGCKQRLRGAVNDIGLVKNLVCLRGELRSGLAVPVLAGVLKGTLLPMATAAQAAPANAKK
jgi:hypothetical protein